MQYEKETDRFLINGYLVPGNDVEDMLYNHVKSAMDRAKERVVLQTQGEEHMTQDEIIEMARQAGFETMFRKGRIHGFERDGDYTEDLEAFAKLVAAKEREACAKEVENALYGQEGCDKAAMAVRARGEE